MGVVISHLMEDGSEQTIGYASSSLSSVKKKYSQLVIAIIFGVKKFHPYLYGQSFTIYTDHQPLKHLFNDSRPVPVMAFIYSAMGNDTGCLSLLDWLQTW